MAIVYNNLNNRKITIFVVYRNIFHKEVHTRNITTKKYKNVKQWLCPHNKEIIKK